METEEFELVPASPIRRIEKRLKKLEKVDANSDIKKLTDHILDLIDSNQKVVEAVVISNNELKKEIARLPEKMEDFMEEIKHGFKTMKSPSHAVSEMPIDSLDVLLRQMNKLIIGNKKHLKVSNASLDHLYQINKRLKRIYFHNAQLARKVDLNNDEW
ncbi:MAG: hypothetical protein KKB03_04175 [Nanoarchaeota archaeon]|nr:hypothetical protein [Nanoarchaeota archaeon]MBU1135523.1 hypothetical protein [Nanoarchaeota archaeon]MBU2520411.1 hypothetical protein [Nanoarchaeota archaeon]